MKINYFSDLHLEFGKLDLPTVNADLIIAAGDIGLGTQGVAWLKGLRKPVIYVAGNHEFYGSEYQKNLEAIRKECAGTHIRFLENESVVLPGLRILGCTLWSNLLVEGVARADELELRLNDFRHILFGKKGFDISTFMQLHKASTEWLSAELAKPFNGQTIVVTHHAPTEWSWNDAPNALKKVAYCSDLKSLLHEYPITLWIHGHIHSPADYRTAGVRVLCNPRGYVGKKIVPGFDQNKIVEI